MNKRFFLWSVSVWLYSFPFYSDLFISLSVVAGGSNSFFHISPHFPQLQSLIHLLVLQLLHTFQILYLPTAPVGVPIFFDIKRIILIEIGKFLVPFVLCDVIFVA